MNIFNLLRRLKYNISASNVRKDIKQKATLIGGVHNFEPTANIVHHFGANKHCIVLDDHSELFGRIICWGNECKVHIGKWVKVGFRSTINCVTSIEIGVFTAIADNVTIVDHNFHPTNPADRKYMQQTPHGSYERSALVADRKPIKIGENVWIGENVRICKGVNIGENSVIGANSVVTKDIPANCIAVGIPARVVKTNIDIETIPIFHTKKEI